MAEQLNALSHRYVHSAVSVRVVPARAGADAAPDAVEQARTATASLEQQALSPVQSPMLIQDLAIDLYPSHTGYRVWWPEAFSRAEHATDTAYQDRQSAQLSGVSVCHGWTGVLYTVGTPACCWTPDQPPPTKP